MTHTAPPTNGAARNGGGRFSSQRADLEELLVEVQARIDGQLGDHAEQCRLLIEDRNRDAISDRAFAAAILNARHQVDHGSRDQQLDAIARVERSHDLDEAADDLLVESLFARLGIHNVDLHDLRRLIRANARAITDGEPVELEPAIPAHLLERQHRAARA